ncbi:hypothetical protein ONZ51_g2421 [Trametes cubensis]|uniref:Uncharacterized protein n=1 Tax=Trametes cubensis TaxID=1111947 RepID=A0AAD7U0F8_9APHY|nr:hypothetical protein ONZ51_g2421 [Trametes cubensis]
MWHTPSASNPTHAFAYPPHSDQAMDAHVRITNCIRVCTDSVLDRGPKRIIRLVSDDAHDDGPFMAVQFTVYEQLKAFLDPVGAYSPATHILAGSLAGAVTRAEEDNLTDTRVLGGL